MLHTVGPRGHWLRTKPKEPRRTRNEPRFQAPGDTLPRILCNTESCLKRDQAIHPYRGDQPGEREQKGSDNPEQSTAASGNHLVAHRFWYKIKPAHEYRCREMCASSLETDIRMKMSTRVHLTSSLITITLVVVAACARSQNPVPEASRPRVSDPHRAEPLEGDISDREKRELEIREEQTIGKVIASPDGSFFLYEWRRPYSWDKDFGILPKSVQDHMQSWIYRVDPEISPTDSKYLFLYESGASQWLGALSPNAKLVSFFSLDDDNKLKAGVWDFANSKITWFNESPDALHLKEGPFWISNQELIYRGGSIKLGRANLLKANLLTGKAKPCPECEPLYTEAMTTASRKDKTPIANDLGPNAKLLAYSRTGQLAVYEESTPDSLTLLFQKGTESPHPVFENSRLGSGPSPYITNAASPANPNLNVP